MKKYVVYNILVYTICTKLKVGVGMTEVTLIFLILFPLIVALGLLISGNHSFRGFIVKLSAVVIAGTSVYLLISNLGADSKYFKLENELVSRLMFFIELGLGVFIFYLGIKYKKYLAPLFITLQMIISIWFETVYGHSINAENNMFIDKFSVIMALIIGIIGSLICVYALGYMQDFHHHNKDIKDRSKLFFFIMFVFLSAMFGIVFSNNLMWIYFFWEITTICSFLLIGYTRTKEAINNSFRALIMNLLGGLAFGVAIPYLFITTGVIELDKMLGLEKALVLIPAVLICFSGITKSAQMPFSSWLLGAMVAPTPTSALLHSSTMVKAGVYIIVRLAPVIGGTLAGYMVALVGAFTFVLASIIAISQSNGKRVLAYSTVANLGLIVVCGGIGTYEAVWAAILLIIFHAVAKSLLFLSVGTVEHNIGSRDIEDMDGLIVRMPKITIMMVVGIAGMFLAPFGMLISKWAALKAVVDANPILAVFIAFGSAVTLFFWTKWLGKLIAVPHAPKIIEDKVNKDEWFPLSTLAVLTVVVCVLFPVVSSVMINPYVQSIFGHAASMDKGNVIIMLIMMALVLLLPAILLHLTKDLKEVNIYLGGTNVADRTKFYGSMGETKDLTLKNYYMDKYFGEARLSKLAVVLCTITIVIMFLVAIIYI